SEGNPHTRQCGEHVLESAAGGLTRLECCPADVLFNDLEVSLGIDFAVRHNLLYFFGGTAILVIEPSEDRDTSISQHVEVFSVSLLTGLDLVHHKAHLIHRDASNGGRISSQLKVTGQFLARLNSGCNRTGRLCGRSIQAVRSTLDRIKG